MPSGLQDISDFLGQGLEELQVMTAYMGVTGPEPPSAPEPMPEMPDVEEPGM
jgi:hypothetical protein